MTSRYNALPQELATTILHSARSVHSASARCKGAAHRRKLSASGVSGIATEFADKFNDKFDDEPKSDKTEDVAPSKPVAKTG